MNASRAVALIAALASVTPALADVPVQPPPVEPADPLTTETWRPERRLRLHWGFLNLPERVVELVLLPVGMVVMVAQEHRLDKRFKTLFSFWDGRIKVTPRFRVSFGDGLGLGAKVKYKEKYDERTSFSVGAVYRLDGDYSADSAFEQPIGTLNDRVVSARAEIEVDKNERFYGLGGGSEEETRRALTSNHQSLFGGIDITPKDWNDYDGLFELGMLRQTLAPGVDPPNIPVGSPGDMVPVPPGFGETTLYASANVVGEHDTRDTHGRPSRGVYVQAGASALVDVSGGGLAGVQLKVDWRWFLPILPEARTLLLSAGATAALPLYPGAEIPFETLATIGRENHMRGYDRVRYRDRYAAWAGAEYRFPIFEYQNTDVGLDSFVFAEGGTAFGEDALQLNRLRYSVGGGLRAGHETRLLSQLTVGWSSEGIQIFIGGETDF